MRNFSNNEAFEYIRSELIRMTYPLSFYNDYELYQYSCVRILSLGDV